MIDPVILENWKEIARRDDWHLSFVGSDIRRMLDNIERLRAALKVARQWMPIQPIPNTGAVEDCALVDAALGNQQTVEPGK